MAYELSIIDQVAQKPNRLTDIKDKNYHCEFGRWAVWHANNAKYLEHQNNIATNRAFFAPNKQWGYEEDYVGFLMDTSGNTTNRIKVEMNYIQILVNQYVGNAAMMNVTARCHSFSPMVQTRKEQELNKLLIKYDITKYASPEISAMYKSNLPIGDSEMETATNFDNYYTDKFVKAMNSLLRYGENVNNFNLMKGEFAESLCLAGMAVCKPEPYGGEFRFRWVQPERFFFDRDARKWNLSDAAYMGEYDEALATEVIEMYPNISQEDRIAIENYTSNANAFGVYGRDRVRVYRTYWRDLSEDLWGYIEDEFGDIIFERINYTYEFEEKPRYTESDVVSVSKLSPYQRDIVKKSKGDKGKAMIRTYTDQWRYCEFIPYEYMNSGYGNRNKASDLVLEYGVVPYQEPNVYSPYNMESPYKVAMYIYEDGFVYSPVDIAINPQRLANRIMSVVENMMNNSRGSGTVIAQEAIEKSDMDEAEISTRMKHNETIVVSGAAFGGVQNAVTKYDATLGNGAFEFLNMANVFLGSIEKITGVNDAVKGQQTSPDQLVGTMQLMIQRSSVIQERYYAALRELFRQMYQALATSGKRLYINEKPRLVSIVGDDGFDVIELTKEMALEDFRVTVKYSNDPETERQQVDAMLMQLLQAGLIDKKRWANLIGRGNSDDMYQAIREFANESDEAEKQMAMVQQADMMKQQASQQQNVDRAFASQDADRQASMVETAMKTQAKNQPSAKQGV